LRSSNHKPNINVVPFTAEKTYINKTIKFLFKQKCETYLEEGEYSFPFEILLPGSLPTSFEHEYGHIRYSIRATVDIPWAIDKHTLIAFTVISPNNLNSLGPTIRQPFGVSGSKIFCCLCCSSQPVTAKFEVFKGFFLFRKIDLNVYLKYFFLSTIKRRIRARRTDLGILSLFMRTNSILTFRNMKFFI